MIGAVLDRSAIAAWGRLDQHMVAWMIRAEDTARPLLIAASELARALADAQTLHEVETIGHLVEMGMTVPPPAGDLTPSMAFHVADVLREAKDADVGLAHTLVLAVAREWPILTADRDRWTPLFPSVRLEELPA